MAGLQYSKAGDFSPLTEQDMSVKTPSLRPIARNFAASIQRLHSFWAFLPHLIELSSVNIARLTEAIFSLTGKPLLTENEANDAELVKRVHERVWTDINQRAKAQDISELKAAGYDFHRGVNRFDALLDSIPTLQPEAKSALASQVLNAWTAFEVLSVDLWVAALNENPTELVQAFIQTAEKNSDKTIPISVIQKVGYDLAHSMGTVLRETGS